MHESTPPATTAYHIDLHTHSVASPDGNIRPEQYQRLLETGKLHAIAVTDHDRIDLALELHRSLGDRIIVGEEITTRDGEIIGLFLQKVVEPGQPALETAQAIKAQGGLVYIPHPFETIRKGLTLATLDKIAEQVDIVEAHNGRALLQNRGPQAVAWAIRHHKALAASSDAHGLKGMGHTYSTLRALPAHDTLVELLNASQRQTGRPPFVSLLYPKLNRLRKRVGA